MKTTRRSHKLLATVAAASLVLAACGGDDDDADGDVVTEDTGADEPADEPADAGEEPADSGEEPAAEPAEEPAAEPADGASGGTLIWAHEQEPPDLHLDDPNNNLTTTSWTIQSMLDGLYGITASTEFFPELLAEEATITENGDGSVTGSFVLRDGLVWSDGDDLTSDDVKFYLDVVMAADGEDEEGNPNYVYLIGDRTGYDTVTDFTVVSPTEFEITWSAFYSGYPAMFARIYPSHVFPTDPVEAATAMNESLPEWNVNGTVIPSSGPMVFDSWSAASR